MVAGAVEGFVTYPADFVKTRAQFASGSIQGGTTSITSILRSVFREKGVRGFYSGSGALITGNAIKAGVRFLTYDTIKEKLRDKDGKLSRVRTMLAGLAAGTVEATIAVTPSETIKTKLIQDAARPHPLYTSTIDGTLQICRTEGIGGIYRGLWPTIMKQGANSAVRFTSYSFLRDVAVDHLRPPSGNLTSSTTFLIGAMAGVVTVYSTMPFDTIKTRMQGLDAKAQYRNSLDCLVKTVKQEGVLRLWGGTTPRLVRLSMSGGIVFTVYEACMGVMIA